MTRMGKYILLFKIELHPIHQHHTIELKDPWIFFYVQERQREWANQFETILFVERLICRPNARVHFLLID